MFSSYIVRICSGFAANSGKPFWISCLHKCFVNKKRPSDATTIYSHIPPLVLVPAPPPRRGHTCLCLLGKPVYPVQMLLLFSPRHAHLRGPCSGCSTTMLPTGLPFNFRNASQLLDCALLLSCWYCMWTAGTLSSYYRL